MAERKPEDAPKTEFDHDAPQTPEAVREVIEHTDSGSGRSQKEHWPADEHGEANQHRSSRRRPGSRSPSAAG
jgi:hypothetical protein